MPIFKPLNHAFFSKWSPSMAYVLGYFAADGSMIRNTRGACFVEFTTTDLVLIKNLRSVTGAGHSISVRPKKNVLWKTQYRIQIGSKRWFNDLIRLGFTPSKSKTIQLPKIPSVYFGDFVRGYFDGDGCVYFKKLKYADRASKRWALLTLFTSGSDSFLKSFHRELKRRGVVGGSLRVKKRGFDLCFSHRDSLALYQLMYHTTSATELCLPRKHSLFKRAINTLYAAAAV